MKNFFPNKTAFYALIAACFVVCVTMGVRQTFGLYSSEFETTGGTSNTEFGLAVAVHAIFWGIFTPIFGSFTKNPGMHMRNKIIEKIIKDICQVETFLKIFARIGKINIPKPPQAVTIPAALLLFSFGKCFEIIGVRMVPAAPAKPKPTSNPKLICNHMPEMKLFPISSSDIE